MLRLFLRTAGSKIITDVPVLYIKGFYRLDHAVSFCLSHILFMFHYHMSIEFNLKISWIPDYVTDFKIKKRV